MFDHRFEFARLHIVILYLDVNPGRFARLGVTNIDVAGALEEKLMECRLKQPERYVTGRVARLEVESFSSVDASHRLRREQGTAPGAGLFGLLVSFGHCVVTALCYFTGEKRFIDAASSRRGNLTVESVEKARSAASSVVAFSI